MTDGIRISPDRVRTADSTITGRGGHPIPVRDYLPAQRSDTRPFLWVHGGGFMMGGLEMKESDAVAREIAAHGRPVRTVDYRLAPTVNFVGKLKLKPSDNRYPGPLHDVLDTYLDLATAWSSTPILGGASAGADLALAAALRLRDGEGASPAALVLLYGTFHGHPAPMPPELSARLRLRDRALGVFLGADSLERMNMNYGGTAESLDDHSVFPGGGDLRGLPPTLVLNADRDGLRASGDAIAVELGSAGVPVTASVLADAAHGFLNKPKTVHFRQGVDEMINWMNGQD
jgi:acetyl esterase